MKKYLLYILNVVIALAMISCSGHDDDMDDNGNGGGGGGTTPETLTVITGTPTEITESSAKIPVEVKGKNLIARGVCYSIATNPTVDGSKTNEGTTSGSITSTISSLASGTTYYVRGYATNKSGTIYGEEKQFTTKEETQPETGIKIATLIIKDIKGTSAISGGNITDDGGFPLIDNGICWSETELPTVDDFVVSENVGLRSYSLKISGLNRGTTYYVRSFATNIKGTTYGQQVSFTTLQNCCDIPDPNFLLGILPLVDSNKNEVIDSEELNIKILNVSNKNIISLKGIEFFTQLEDLDCSNNNLSELDIRHNTNLKILNCIGNELLKNKKITVATIFNSNNIIATKSCTTFFVDVNNARHFFIGDYHQQNGIEGIVCLLSNSDLNGYFISFSEDSIPGYYYLRFYPPIDVFKNKTNINISLRELGKPIITQGYWTNEIKKIGRENIDTYRMDDSSEWILVKTETPSSGGGVYEYSTSRLIRATYYIE